MQTILSRMSRMPAKRSAASNQNLGAASTTNVVCNANNNEQVDAAERDMMHVEEGDINNVRSISKAPKTLLVLWQEFKFGIGQTKGSY